MSILRSIVQPNYEFVIGQALEHDDKRKEIMRNVNISFIQDEKLKQIAIALKKEDFSFPKLMIESGREILVYAMYLAEKTAKKERQR